MIATNPTARACKVCEASFLPFTSTQTVCGVKCAQKLPVLTRKAAKKAAKDDRERTKARLAELRPLSYWRHQAQKAFNEWVRLRDAALPCISCDDRLVGVDRFGQGRYDAGHYLTTGARPELRFDEQNVHRQCKQCNLHLHGNAAAFRLGLIRRIGAAAVDRLEGPHEPKHYSAADLQVIRNDYRARSKALKAEQ